MSTTPPTPPPARSTTPAAPATKGLSAKAIVAIALLALALVFIFSNLEDGTLQFLGFSFVMPIWIWFLGVLLVGVIIGSLFPWFMPKKKPKK